MGGEGAYARLCVYASVRGLQACKLFTANNMLAGEIPAQVAMSNIAVRYHRFRDGQE